MSKPTNTRIAIYAGYISMAAFTLFSLIMLHIVGRSWIEKFVLSGKILLAVTVVFALLHNFLGKKIYGGGKNWEPRLNEFSWRAASYLERSFFISLFIVCIAFGAFSGGCIVVLINRIFPSMLVTLEF